MNDKSTSNQIVAKIKSVTNILVTLSRSPSVDQLAAALGLTILLDKMGKHATAVFSGEIPPAINFLEPEKTFENNADSLRDFIISLDKQKADRLRFKVEGDIVKVLITPYRTTIAESDLSFSEGEFNVELVLAIGVDKKEDLDDAISAHGRIFHDATIATINIDSANGSLGSINWQDSSASSFCEMIFGLSESLGSKDKSFVDDQVATALLTGIVSSTDQFMNDKTSPSVMTLAANLMAKGANQQLISSELAAIKGEAGVSLISASDETSEIKISPTSSDQDASLDGLSLNHDNDTEEVSTISEDSPKMNRPGDPVESETVRLADKQSADALAIAESQLTEAQLARPNDTPDVMSAEVEDAAHEDDLDKIIQAVPTGIPIIEDLNRDQESVNRPLSHGTPYVEEVVKNPLASSLVNDEPSLVDPTGDPGLEDGRNRIIQPLPSSPMISTVPASVGTKPSVPNSVDTAIPTLTALDSSNVNLNNDLQAALMAAQSSDSASNQLAEAQVSATLPERSADMQISVDNNLGFSLPPPPPPILPGIGDMPPSPGLESASNLVPIATQYSGEASDPALELKPFLGDPAQYKIPGQ